MIWDIFSMAGEFTGRQVVTEAGATAQDAWIAAGRPEERMQYVERIQGMTAEQSLAKQQANWGKAIRSDSPYIHVSKIGANEWRAVVKFPGEQEQAVGAVGISAEQAVERLRQMYDSEITEVVVQK